jgi:hypothetical protein
MRIKHITVRVIAAEFDADAVKAERTVFRAPPGKVYVESTREQIIERVVNYLDKKYPTIDFRMVDVDATQINFVPTGPREREASDEGRDREQDEQGGHGSVGDSRGPA